MKKAGRTATILKYLAPVAIFAIVWYVTLPVLRYTMLMKEQTGIFLFTPDYFRQVFAGKWPVTTLLGDFLVQFYRVASLGALITAIFVTLEYILVCRIFRFSSLRQIAGGIAAAGLWYLLAKAHTLQPAVATVVFTGILAIAVSIFLKFRHLERKASGSWQALVAVAMIIVSATIIVKDKKIREFERWYAVEYCTRSHDWDTVLAIATPAQCRQDMSFTPYALLALNAKGHLHERFTDYPVSKKEDLGDIGEMSWRDYSLRSQIYEVVGGTDEAIHLAFQGGMSLPHGTSFGILRQLIRLEIENGDYALAKKYATILARSPFNRKTASAAMKMAEDNKKDRGEDTIRQVDAMISDNPVYNTSHILANSPNANEATKDRLLCHLLLAGDMEGYRQLLGSSN